MEVVEAGLDALGETLLGQRYDRLIHALVVRNDEGRGEHLQRPVWCERERDTNKGIRDTIETTLLLQEYRVSD